MQDNVVNKNTGKITKENEHEKNAGNNYDGIAASQSI